MPALEQVTVVCVLLRSASEPTLRGSRLEMLLTRLIDTPVRGVVYDGCGAELVRRVCGHSRIAYTLLDAVPDDHDAWLAGALAAVERLVE